MTDERWIVVPNWERFQHYKDRDPTWIKTYNELLQKPEYLDLTLAERGLLHGIWSLYALSDGQLRAKDVGHLATCRPRDEHWESLTGAGFIEFSASRPLALARSREKRREEKKELARSLARKPTPKPAPAMRMNASAYQPGQADHAPEITVDVDMLQLAKGWLNQ